MTELSQYTVNYLVELSEINPDREVCGLILANQTVHPILNVARYPQHAFEMDPVQQLEALEAFTVEKVGDRIMGMYHSHPGGNPAPSHMDLAGWPPEGWRYWIIAKGGVREWEIRDGELFCVTTKFADASRKLVGTLPWGTGGS